MEDGTLLIDNGKITDMGTDITVPEGVEILDAAGKWVTPGLIDAHSHLSGLNEPAWMPSTKMCIRDSTDSSPALQIPQLRRHREDPAVQIGPVVARAGRVVTFRAMKAIVQIQ